MKYVVIITRAYDHRENNHLPRVIKQPFIHLSAAHSFIRSMNDEIVKGKITIEIKREHAQAALPPKYFWM